MTEMFVTKGFISRSLVLLTAALLVTPVCFAQPSNNSPNQFGDRQIGKWGDPAQGYFGNPAAGDFDKSQVKVPPPGMKPLGKVYQAAPPANSPYISLPEPEDSVPAVVPATKPSASNKKPAKKRALKRRTTN